MQNNSARYCTFYIVRHGETDWNKKDIYQGHQQIPINGEGKLQANNLRKKIENIRFDALYSSDLLRARETAEILALKKKLAVQTTSLLRERSMGRFEGKQRRLFLTQMRGTLEKFASLAEEERWKFKISDDIESDEEIVTRLITFLREVAALNVRKKILIVSHNICIIIFLMRIGFLPYKTDIPIGSFSNGGYIVLLTDGVEFFVKEVHGLDKTKFYEK